MRKPNSLLFTRRNFIKSTGATGAAIALSNCVEGNYYPPIPKPDLTEGRFGFPKDFQWGVATSAFQIEGATSVDGRGASVWDEFAKLPGKITNGDTADVACDHYHRFSEDIDLIADLGVDVYRFSIAWPRIFPEGRGTINEKGVDFYKRLLDKVQARGLTPHITLYHWDTPQALQDAYRGWESRQIADDFADYCTAVVNRLGDRVTDWYTLNEVHSFILQAYTFPGGPEIYFAPFITLESEKKLWQTVQNALIAHGKGVQAIRAAASRRVKVGFVDDSTTYVPVSETPEDIEATKKAFRSLAPNGGVIVPIVTGKYDPDFLKSLGSEAPDISDADLQVIGQPIDVLGYNVYRGEYVRAADNERGFEVLPKDTSYPTMSSTWLYVVPESIYWGVRMFTDSLGHPELPIIITENGASANDVVNANGEIIDLSRIYYLRDYLRNAQLAAAEGYPLKGYFVWSYMDNFEWASGYSKRFGITYVDFATQKRTPKESYKWFKRVVAANRVL